MTTEDIIEFLRNGELSNFPFGTDLDKITNDLGDNLGWTVQLSRKDKRPALIKYDMTEFYFDDQDTQKLCGVRVTYSQSADKKGLEMNYSDLRRQLSYDETKNFLSGSNIPFEEATSEYDGETRVRVIRTLGQVTFYFLDDNSLDKFGRFLRE